MIPIVGCPTSEFQKAAFLYPRLKAAARGGLSPATVRSRRRQPGLGRWWRRGGGVVRRGGAVSCIGVQQGWGGWALRPRSSGSGRAPLLCVLQMSVRWMVQGAAGDDSSCCSSAASFTGPDWARPDPVRTGVPRRGFTGPLDLARPDGDWYALLPCPVDYRPRRWRLFPPVRP